MADLSSRWARFLRSNAMLLTGTSCGKGIASHLETWRNTRQSSLSWGLHRSTANPLVWGAILEEMKLSLSGNLGVAAYCFKQANLYIQTSLSHLGNKGQTAEELRNVHRRLQEAVETVSCNLPCSVYHRLRVDLDSSSKAHEVVQEELGRIHQMQAGRLPPAV